MKIKVLVKKFVDYVKTEEKGKKVYAKVDSILEREENDERALKAIEKGWAEIVEENEIVEEK